MRTMQNVPDCTFFKYAPEKLLLDLEHLACQTMDDKDLQSEVLELFHQQLLSSRGRIEAMNPQDRCDLAHRLVGAARGVGAFSFAQCAEKLESDPSNRNVIEHMLNEIDALAPFVRALIQTQNVAKG